MATFKSSAQNGASANGNGHAPRILVTGGAGYIGSVLVGRLLARGYRVRVLDTLYWGTRPLSGQIERIELVQGDIRDIRDEWLDGVDAVAHLAGLSNDPTAEYDPKANWEMNAIGTERLAEACRRKGIQRLTFGSSCSLYDGLPAGDLYDETAEIRPLGAYAEGKLYAEQRLQALTDDDFCPVMLRQATVFGFSTRMRYDLVVNTFVKDAMSLGRLQLHGAGAMSRPLVDVVDVADAHVVCLEAPADDVRGQVFNVVQDNYQIRELASLVATALRTQNYPVELISVPPPPRIRDYKCSNEKMTRALGFTPHRTIPGSIAHMISWIKSDGYMEFDNPKFYNIRWMELLKEREATTAPTIESVAARPA